MTGRNSGPQGPTQGDAARGFDAAYQEQREVARRELAETLAGPQGQQPVSADHTALKNPNGEFANPAPHPPHASPSGKRDIP